MPRARHAGKQSAPRDRNAAHDRRVRDDLDGVKTKAPGHAITPISTAEREHLRSDHAKALVDCMPIDLHTAILEAVVFCGGGFLVIGALTPESGYTSAQVRHKLAVKPS
jgi:hypothetical protein